MNVLEHFKDPRMSLHALGLSYWIFKFLQYTEQHCFDFIQGFTKEYLDIHLFLDKIISSLLL